MKELAGPNYTFYPIRGVVELTAIPRDQDV